MTTAAARHRVRLVGRTLVLRRHKMSAQERRELDSRRTELRKLYAYSFLRPEDRE